MFKKSIGAILAALLIMFGIFIFLYSPVIFQEGNPWPQIKGILQINFFGKEIVKISEVENKYLTRSKNGAQVIQVLLRRSDYEFMEQMGAGYIFKSRDGRRIVATHRFYSRFYSIWRVER